MTDETNSRHGCLRRSASRSIPAGPSAGMFIGADATTTSRAPTICRPATEDRIHVNQIYLTGLGDRNVVRRLRSFYFDVQDADPTGPSGAQAGDRPDARPRIYRAAAGAWRRAVDHHEQSTNVESRPATTPDSVRGIIDRFRGLAGGTYQRLTGRGRMASPVRRAGRPCL